MISASLEGRLAYMTYPEPWRGPPKQHPEFLRPAPKPVTSRYNGVSNASPNGTRLAPSQRSITKYPSPPTVPAPVNLTQHKDEVTDELPYSPYRLYTPAHFTHFSPFTTMYQTPYSHMMRPTFPTTPLPPLETYSPTTPTAITVSSTFLSPPSTYSPPAAIKPGQSILRDKRTPPQPPPPPTSHHQQQQQQHLNQQTQVAFKVPSGKEGSLKHRILTRPEDNSGRCLTNSSNNNSNVPLDLQKTPEAVRKRLNAATMSPPRSPKKSQSNNNNPVLGSFAKGVLIKLASGELRRIEDMRTEDFVNSAERCPELRLADSTVVKIEENHTIGIATVTLSYNQRRTQVEVEAAIEHPFFVFGQGWASCNPDRTQQLCKLKVHRLQVGDIVVSLTPREQFANLSLSSSSTSSSSITSSSSSGGAIQQLPRPPTIVTTATSTSMTSRQISVNPPIQTNQINNNNDNNNNSSNNRDDSNYQPINLQTTHHPAVSPDSLAARKRRWSAPEICDDNDTTTIRRRID